MCTPHSRYSSPQVHHNTHSTSAHHINVTLLHTCTPYTRYSGPHVHHYAHSTCVHHTKNTLVHTCTTTPTPHAHTTPMCTPHQRYSGPHLQHNAQLHVCTPHRYSGPHVAYTITPTPHVPPHPFCTQRTYIHVTLVQTCTITPILHVHTTQTRFFWSTRARSHSLHMCIPHPRYFGPHVHHHTHSTICKFRHGK